MKGAVLLLLIAGVAFPSVVGYHIEPVKALWSGLAGPEDGVSQTVVVCWDSLDRVELFAGARGNGGAYTATVYDGSTRLTGCAGNNVPEHGWVKFTNWDDTVAFTKGKTLTIRFTRSGDSIEYYYDHSDPYKYGEIPNDIVPNGADLCARVYGRMNQTDSAWWGMIPWFPVVDEESLPVRRARWLAREQATPIGIAHVGIYWDLIKPTRTDTYRFAALDTEVLYLDSVAGIEILGRIQRCPSWASSRVESATGETSHLCAPRNLFLPVDHDSNYWARFVDTVVRRYKGRIHVAVNSGDRFIVKPCVS